MRALILLTYALGSLVAGSNVSWLERDFTDDIVAESLEHFNVGIFVILSQEKRDRQQHMQSVLHSLGVNNSTRVHIVPAVSKTVLATEYSLDRLEAQGRISADYRQRYLSNEQQPAHRDANLARLACQLSHVAALNALARSKYTHGVVLEDDVMPNPDITLTQTRLVLAAAVGAAAVPSIPLLFLGWCWECGNWEQLNEVKGLGLGIGLVTPAYHPLWYPTLSLLCPPTHFHLNPFAKILRSVSIPTH